MVVTGARRTRASAGEAELVPVAAVPGAGAAVSRAEAVVLRAVVPAPGAVVLRAAPAPQAVVPLVAVLWAVEPAPRAAVAPPAGEVAVGVAVRRAALAQVAREEAEAQGAQVPVAPPSRCAIPMLPTGVRSVPANAVPRAVRPSTACARPPAARTRTARIRTEAIAICEGRWRLACASRTTCFVAGCASRNKREQVGKFPAIVSGHCRKAQQRITALLSLNVLIHCPAGGKYLDGVGGA